MTKVECRQQVRNQAIIDLLHTSRPRIATQILLDSCLNITKKGKKMLEEYNSQIKSLADRITEITQSEDLPQIVATLEQATA